MTQRALSRKAPRTGVDWFLTFMRVAALTVIGLGLLAFIAQEINADNPFARWANPDATGLTGAQFQGLIISGVTQGAMYGLIALGYSMVYGVLGFINFAHGEVFMVGAMTGMITSNKLADAGLWESNFVGSLVFIMVVSILVCSLTAVIMERVAYRPLRGSPRLIPLITSIGVSFFLQNASVVLLGPAAKAYPDVPDWIRTKHTFLDIEGARILVILVAAASMICLWYFVERTKSGKAMRAVAEDAEIAALMGINGESHHREGVRAGRGHGGVGRDPVGDLVPQRDPHHRFPPRHQGLQRRGGWRHRPSWRCHGRRTFHRGGRIGRTIGNP